MEGSVDTTLDVMVILDRSGSMSDAKRDHEGGLKSFVSEQAKVPGDVRFTLVQFDTGDPCEVVYDRVPIGDVGDISLVPRGGTPLLEAVGLAIAHLQTRTPNNNVVCMIVTDGEENSSGPEWPRARVADRIKQLESDGWTFVFLGANIDSVQEAAAVGVSGGAVMDFSNDSVGVASAYMAAVSNLRGARLAYNSATSEAHGGTVDFKQFDAMLAFSDAQKSAAKGDSDGRLSRDSDSESDTQAKE